MPIDLEHQRKRAKDLRRAHAAGSAEAAHRVAAHLPRARGLSPDAILATRLTLAEAQLVVAREAGFASWPKLKHATARADDLDALLDAALAGEAVRGAHPASIHAAAALGDADHVAALLAAEPARVAERGGQRAWPPLLYACCARYGRRDPAIVEARVRIARALLAGGADVDARGAELGFGSEQVDGFDVEVWCALAGAAGRVGSAELMRVLLDAGANVEYAPALLKHAVWSGDLRVLEAAIAARPPWWQAIWALVACADLDLPVQARMLVPYAPSPTAREPAIVRALREERGRELIEVLLGDTTAAPEQRRAVEDRAYRAARRYHHAAAAALLRARGATDDVLTPADRAIAGEHVAVARFRDDDHRMLSWAIAKRHWGRVPHLLAIGLHPDVHDEAGELPLHHAVRAGADAVVAQLLAAGARRDATNFDGETAFGDATADPSPAVFERAADAVAAGDLDTLRALLDDEPELAHARSPRTHRCTLLHYCAANGTEAPRQRTPPNAPAVAALLLERGAEPDATCKLYGGGATTLGLVLTSMHPRAAHVDGELVRVLARHGARIDDDAVALAVAHASPRALAALVEAGAPVNLLVAAALGDAALVERELATTAVDARFADGYTALHAAAGMGHAEIVRLLLARGADATLRDTRWGGTPADKARHFEHPELAALLDG